MKSALSGKTKAVSSQSDKFLRSVHPEPYGDPEPFLSQRTLAHAFFPSYGGDVHMNEERRWTAGPFLLEVSPPTSKKRLLVLGEG